MLHILEPGLSNTIQDAGRWGYQSLGVPVSGAMDLAAFRAANELARNAWHSAALEIHSPLMMQTDAPHLVAVTGADAGFSVNGRAMPLAMSVFTRAGSLIEIKPHRAGWVYLAIHGGVAVPRVMGSRATCVRGGFGGMDGRALVVGDQIPIGEQTLGDLVVAAARGGGEQTQARLRQARVMLGPHHEQFADEAIVALTTTAYTLTPLADRMGYRFNGVALARRDARELLSCGAPLGAIQVPSDGQPIVLMADHQTTGGYPIIATVIADDLPIIAQCIPGETISFQVV